MPTLLLELFSEEIPSRMQRGAAEQLQRLMLAGFEKNMLRPTECKTFVSPRHLAIQCFGLPSVQPDVKEEKRGPKLGAPEQALNGFLNSSGLTIDQCKQRDGYYYATIERKGQPVSEVVKKIIEDTLTAFGWPKSMRWGNRPLAWVRPLHRIACLLDDAEVPVQFAHLTASNITEGHRFLAPAPFALTHAEAYEGLLKDAFVVVDFEKRKNYIGNAVHNLAVQHGLQVVDDNALLDEVTGLVEHAVPLLCQFEEKFLELPPEVLISEMKTHQRYFALVDAAGKLANQFITVANMVNADGGAKVREGNARVVRARLSDGEFYWNQDRLTKLEDWGKKLSDVVFHAKVGMMDAKVARIEALAVEIARMLSHPPEIVKNDFDLPPAGGSNPASPLASSPASGGSNPPLERIGGGDLNLETVRRTARLCKADLTSGMVGEFPELQGIMGRYYALAQGETAEVADAIRDHYKPLGASDSVPEGKLAAIIAIADKLDSIVSLFAAGEKPTGSKDPLALRRAALGVLRILDHHKWELDIDSLIADKKIAGEIVLFFFDRLNNLLREKDIHYYVIDALFVDGRDDALVNSATGTTPSRFVPVKITQQAQALQNWLATPAGTTTLAAIKRAMNILAAEEKKSKTTFAPSTSGASEPSEKALVAALAEVDSRWSLPRATSRGANDKHPAALEALAAPIQQFFTDLMVTEEGFREARLSLLAAVREAANTIADFSKIEG